ncbi:MAG: phosphate acetyltransferase [Candidatus Woesearchaeota archaeon]
MKEFMAMMKEKAQASPMRIVFPESTEERTLRAIQIVKYDHIALPILIGNRDNILARLRQLDLNSEGIKIVDPLNFEKFEEYAQNYFELRKHKGVTPEQSREIMKNPDYFSTMMVHMGDADGLVSGALGSTADTVRPALQIIKTKEPFHKVSGLFLMIYEERMLLFADCAITIDPDAKDLAEIALDSAHTARKLGLEPKVAMISFSTKGSASHPLVDKVKEATEIVKSKDPNLIVEGELQVDAALVPMVAKIKCKGCAIQGDANVLIFPDLNSGNIAYKLVERLARFKAVGPILQGLKKPVNDLSRGCSVQDIVDVTIITGCEAQGN